jgi:hypothetical protein
LVFAKVHNFCRGLFVGFVRYAIVEARQVLDAVVGLFFALFCVVFWVFVGNAYMFKGNRINYE